MGLFSDPNFGTAVSLSLIKAARTQHRIVGYARNNWNSTQFFHAAWRRLSTTAQVYALRRNRFSIFHPSRLEIVIENIRINVRSIVHAIVPPRFSLRKTCSDCCGSVRKWDHGNTAQGLFPFGHHSQSNQGREATEGWTERTRTRGPNFSIAASPFNPAVQFALGAVVLALSASCFSIHYDDPTPTR